MDPMKEWLPCLCDGRPDYVCRRQCEPRPPVETKVKSDGSSTDYYAIPEGAVDLLDLIEHKKMSFAVGNIFKACYRLGEKDGIDAAYDLRKIKFFVDRALEKLEKSNG